MMVNGERWSSRFIVLPSSAGVHDLSCCPRASIRHVPRAAWTLTTRAIAGAAGFFSKNAETFSSVATHCCTGM
jgi:hypothetical protein